ncbi:hypothetical protein XA68_11886 [Ophiocordyceps unilateralis]|uniref:Uncharacterized protein n=1 Tax=Ophiocordyceps unilateralis TaxID=268505 RepID=A0A2A9PEL4_OPHUN|nr:hypothetical protein XA68_11886 [Ophiocordyceps unilateralis]
MQIPSTTSPLVRGVYVREGRIIIIVTDPSSFNAKDHCATGPEPRDQQPLLASRHAADALHDEAGCANRPRARSRFVRRRFPSPPLPSPPHIFLSRILAAFC